MKRKPIRKSMKKFLKARLFRRNRVTRTRNTQMPRESTIRLFFVSKWTPENKSTKEYIIFLKRLKRVG